MYICIIILTFLFFTKNTHHYNKWKFGKIKGMVLRTLSAVDYVLLVVLLLSSAVIGAIFGFVKSKKSSAKEFLLGISLRDWIPENISFFSFLLVADGGMGVSLLFVPERKHLDIQVWPTALSIMVSFLSAITLLGTPSEVYMYGTMYIYQGEWLIAFAREKSNGGDFPFSDFVVDRLDTHRIGLHAEISRNELHQCLWSRFGVPGLW